MIWACRACSMKERRASGGVAECMTRILYEQPGAARLDGGTQPHLPRRSEADIELRVRVPVVHAVEAHGCAAGVVEQPDAVAEQDRRDVQVDLVDHAAPDQLCS